MIITTIDRVGTYIQGSKNILLDVSDTTNDYFIDRDVNEIDVICISHAHINHFTGLPALLLHNFAQRGRTKPLTVISPRTVKPYIQPYMDLYDLKQTYDIKFEYYDISAVRRWDFNNIIIHARKAIHSIDESYGYLIYNCDCDLLIQYTGDTEILPLSMFADVVIADGTWASDYTGKSYGHSWASDMIKVAHEIELPVLILTHQWYKYQDDAGRKYYTDDVIQTHKDCKNVKRIYIAYAGMQVKV